MQSVYIVNGCRTAIGSFGGALKDTPVVDLGAAVVRETLTRSGVKPEQVDEVIMGCVLTAGLGQNVARQIAIKAGLSVGTPAFTVGMVCGSGMKSLIEGARAIGAGDADIIVAGGAENMSASPYVAPSYRWGARMGLSTLVDTMIQDGLTDAFHDYHMGITAENICDEWGISREELDAFALSSQQKTAAAQSAGLFDAEIVAIPVKVKKESVNFKVDEFPRPDPSAASLARLKPAFMPDGGRVTAGNASGLNDGAAAMLIASEAAVQKYNLRPMAKLISWGQSGVDPRVMGIGPVSATKNALKKAGRGIDDMDLIEANEAFAAQSVAVARDLGFDMTKVNVNGGAVALGHPIGCSGARIIVTLLYEMARRPESRLGLATLCIGGGMGTTVIVEKMTG
ncbi:MAG: acetyl-CoA C-acetyltransferase [Gracilibacteraceae bacterium]|jgi:acetyl-CoA C-acetyltransferase|nr:acetyl-CoA C-acetyltransferase [Gracilibacteraceae bacterium]